MNLLENWLRLFFAVSSGGMREFHFIRLGNGEARGGGRVSATKGDNI